MPVKAVAPAREARLRHIHISHLLHEIRAPLARMRVALSLLSTAPAQSGEDIDRINKEIERIERMMGEMIECERLAGNLIADKKDMIGMALVVQGLLDDLRYESVYKKIQIETQLDEKVQILGSARWVSRAIENILRNALRYGVDKGTIKITLSQKGKYARLIVSDDGYGVAENDLEKIFEPFYRSQVPNSTATHGTGLGLTIVRSVVAHHGGKVWAEHANPGLAIVMDLPVLAARPQERVSASRRQRSSAA